MALSGKKHIFFDWHGVLEVGSFHAIREHLVSTFSCKVGLREQIQQRGRAYASGSMTSDQFWSELAMLTSVEARDQAKEERFKKQPREELWSLLPSLAKRYDLYILSDCPRDKAEFIEERYDLTSFNDVFWSYKYGTTKRDGKFFTDVLSELGIHTREALIVDDSATKIDIAAELGIAGILFTSITDLSTLLR